MGDVLVSQIEWNQMAIPRTGEPPDSCTIRQLYGAVSDAEYAAIDAFLSALPPRKRREIESAAEVHRLHPDVAALIQGANAFGAGIDDARRDDIWRIAQYVS